MRIGGKTIFLLAAATVAGSLFNLLPLILHAQYNKSTDIGRLECFPVGYYTPAKMMRVKRYVFETDMWHWVESAYVDLEQKFAPSVFESAVVSPSSQQDFELAKSSGVKFGIKDVSFVVAPSPVVTGWGKGASDPKAFLKFLQNQKSEVASRTEFLHDAFVRLPSGQVLKLSKFEYSGDTKVKPMTNQATLAAFRRMGEDLTQCVADGILNEPGRNPEK